MTDYERQRIAQDRNTRCKKCKHSKVINAQGDWFFRGCYCKPYRGKWVSEIENCPEKVESEGE